MKKKNISRIIAKKVDAWLASIEDESVRSLAKKNTIVTGGCIASMLMGEAVNDFDIYFRNRDTALAVANYYLGIFNPEEKQGIPCKIYIDPESTDRVKIIVKSAVIASEHGSEKEYEYFEARPDASAYAYVSDIIVDPGDAQEVFEETESKALAVEDKTFRPVFLSTNAITLSSKVQIVMRFFGEPDEIHSNYDFMHCMNYWRSWGDDKLVLKQPALEAILARELIYVGSKYPVCSLVRLRKFISRGWTVNAGQILKMALQVSDLDLLNPCVLEEQLTGVDMAYFAEVIKRARDDDPEKINPAYLIEIIDRIFQS